MDPEAATAAAAAAAGAAAAAAAGTADAGAAAPPMLTGGGGLNGLGDNVPESEVELQDGKETDVADEKDEEGWPRDEVTSGGGEGGGCSARCDVDDVIDA